MIKTTNGIGLFLDKFGTAETNKIDFLSISNDGSVLLQPDCCKSAQSPVLRSQRVEQTAKRTVEGKIKETFHLITIIIHLNILTRLSHNNSFLFTSDVFCSS